MHVRSLVPKKLFKIGLLMLGAFILLVGCCPPNCPPTPLMVDQWDNLYQEGAYENLLQETSLILEQGPDGEFFAEANLYAGLAELKLKGDPELALSYLDEAEKRSSELISLDQTYELTLLFRGKMVALVYLGDLKSARIYRQMAVDMSPELEDEINKEFEDALRESS